MSKIILDELIKFKLIFLVLIFIGCRSETQKETIESSNPPHNKIDTFHSGNISPKASLIQADIPVNEYLAERLEPIRMNFRRINSITNWTKINKVDLWESTEGGEAKFYYSKNNLEKISTQHFGETFQKLTEYFLHKGELSFVLEKTYKYNRPFYFDSTLMKEWKDTVAFDIKKSEIVEDRSYFENNKLIHQINNQDCGSPFNEEYLLKEQKRIKKEFEKVVNLKVDK